MRKLFLVASAVFALSLFINLEKEDNSFGQQALAEGTCCKDGGSICYLTSTMTIVYGWYYKTSGSCKSDNPQVDN